MRIIASLSSPLEKRLKREINPRVYQLTCLDRPLHKKGLGRLLIEEILAQPVDALLLDLDLIDQDKVVSLLRELRLSQSCLHIMVFSRHPDYMASLDLELSALSIFDRIPLAKRREDQKKTLETLFYRLHHPTALADHLEKKSQLQAKKKVKSRQDLAVASLADKAGVTSLCFSLAHFLQEYGPVLLVEACQRPVYEDYFFSEKDLDPQEKTYQLYDKKKLDFLASSYADSWLDRLDYYDYVIQDMGPLAKDQGAKADLDFWRASHKILVSSASPWDLAQLEALIYPTDKVHLFLTFSSPQAFSLIKKRLSKRFLTVVCLPYQPEFFGLSHCQRDLYTKWCLSLGIL